MSGLRVLLNNQELAAVSNNERNIISAYVSGDMIGPELATLHLIGGYYGEPQDTSHRIWLDGLALVDGDEIEIQFSESISTSSSGMSIEEHAKAHAKDEASEEVGDEDIHIWLARQPKARERFSFELEMTNSELIRAKTEPGDFHFHFGVMWKWANPDESSVHLSSASLENMKHQKPSTTLSKLKLLPGEGVKFRVGT